MLPVKISFNNEIKRVSVYTDNDNFTYGNLLETTKTLFPVLAAAEKLSISWSDDEEDVCTCSSDAELTEALRIMNGKTMKFTVSVTPSNPSNGKNSSIHSGITCDGCGMSPIVGLRYKCAVREDFDLCETCEATQQQPYPMIKIYSKDQAPAAIMITLRDNLSPSNHCGPPPPPHHHHHPPRHHMPGHGPHAYPPGTDGPWNYWNGRGPPGCAPRGSGRRGRGGCPRDFLGGLWRKSCNTSVDGSDASKQPPAGSNDEPMEPFMEKLSKTIDSFTDALFTDNERNEEQQYEQQLVDEAVRRSLEESSAAATVTETGMKPSSVTAGNTSDSSPLPEATAVRVPNPVTVTSTGQINSKAVDSSYFTKWAPLSSSVSNPKPMARFVKDVTLPDGSAVVPGSTVVKTWRIRNDEDKSWPEGVSLAFASGDVLAASPEELTVPIDKCLGPYEETEISVRLRIPETTGRHVTYFRLRTKEGHIFGQRLWADLRVVEPDADWVGVKDSLLASTTTVSPTPPALIEPSTASVPAAVTLVTKAPVTVASAVTSTTTTPAPVVVTAKVPQVVNTFITPNSPVSAIVPSTTVSSATPVTASVSTNSLPVSESKNVWTNVWARELQILSDMGFTDTQTLIPLLQEHVGLPVSLCPQLNGVPSAEGMQKLLTVLLSRSFTSTTA